MTPVFPTLTFPNHWALLTGLYPAWSGIVANDFWDPQSEEEFFYSDPERSWDAGWWWGEPVWSVVERYGGKAANIMWWVFGNLHCLDGYLLMRSMSRHGLGISLRKTVLHER